MYIPESGEFGSFNIDSLASGSNFQWLPDGENIIYENNRNIFLTDKSGSFSQQLTVIEELLPELTPAICDVVWSSFVERLYFTIGCADDTEYLYSVDLEGNVRQELSIIELYSEGYMPFFIPMEISGIFPDISSTDLFVLMDVSSANATDSSIDTVHAIYRLTSSGITELIFEKRYSVYDALAISTSSISPDGIYLAFAGSHGLNENSSVLSVIKLSDGSIAFEQSDLQGICDLDWLSTRVLAYEIIPRMNCYADRFAVNIQSVDVSSERIYSVSSSASALSVPVIYPGSP